MKRTLVILVPILLLFASCRKDDLGRPPIDESQWLNKERAVVVHSDFQCPYYVVETYGGYSVLKSWDGIPPARGAVMYGDFNGWGIRTFYNRSEGYLTQSEVTYYWLSYWDAMDEVNYQCNY